MKVRRTMYVLIFVLIALCCTPAWGQTAKATSLMDQYVDRDLRRLPATELAPLIKVLSPEEQTRWNPWYVWALSQAPHGYLVFEGSNEPLLVPSASHSRVTWISPSGNPTKVWSFQMGWRLYPTSGSIYYDSTLSMFLISVKTQHVINRRDMSRVVLGFNGDLDVVRLEDSRGKLIPNRYYSPNLLVGPPPGYKTAADLKLDINSNVPLHVLRGLLFVAGEHRDPSEPLLPNSPPVIKEDDNSTSVSQDLRNDQEVRQLLQRVARSPQPWIRELAENGPYKDR